MFKKIRRNSRQLLDSRRKNSIASTIEPAVEESVAELPSSKIASNAETVSFFHLPAEIRNAIYEDVASGSKLYVALPIKKSSKLPPPTPPSLLLASRQARQEYTPLLLKSAAITVFVRNSDFRNVKRITSSLYSTELKALRNNDRLTIQLIADKPTKDSMASLRRWLVNRSDGLDRLAWHYSIAWPKGSQILPTSTEVFRINTYIQRRAFLNQNLEAMSQLHQNLDETLRFELQPIIATFERELDDIGADPDLPWRHQQAEAALFLYGVTMRSATR